MFHEKRQERLLDRRREILQNPIGHFQSRERLGQSQGPVATRFTTRLSGDFDEPRPGELPRRFERRDVREGAQCARFKTMRPREMDCAMNRVYVDLWQKNRSLSVTHPFRCRAYAG